MADIFRQTFLRIKNKLKRIPRTALLTLVFLFTLVLNSSQTFAAYENYKDLFSGTAVPSQLFKLSLTVPAPNVSSTASVFDIKFQLTASFNEQNGGRDWRDWHWDHVRDFDNSPNVFVFRICDKSNPDENACWFSIIPHKSKISEDQNIFCTRGVCTLPDPTSQPLPKIYHYTADNQGSYLSYNSDQYDKFNVVFQVSNLATLRNNGLNTPTPLTEIFQFGSQKIYKADAWYCAGDASGETLPNRDIDDNVRMFKNLCGDNRPYFRIAQIDDIQMPQNASVANNTSPTTPAEVDTSREEDSLPKCSLMLGSGSFMGCIARLIYYVIYWPVAWFAGLMGTLFDFFLGYSLDDKSYRADFAVKGWQIVRDISNIFFIIILVWTGLSAVFNTEKTNMKKVVPTLILNALIINFSLFATRVVIDLSNITARVFYNTIEITELKDGVKVAKKGIGKENYKPLSEKIVSAFNPQKIFDSTVLDQAKTQDGIDSSRVKSSDSETAGYYIIVTLIAAFILFAIAMMFWKTAFFFLGRVIGLYMAMIFAPFAFLSKGNLPLVSNIKELSWDSWVSDLTKYALLAPIFVFFLYIIYSFLESDFIKIYKNNLSASFFETIIYIAIPMLIVYFMINRGVKIAEHYAGEIGKMVQGAAMKAVGAGVGIATGGAAFAGRNIIGRGLGAIGKSKVTYKDKDGNDVETTRAAQWAANSNNSLFARKWNNAYNKSQTSSFDVRNAGIKIGGKDYSVQSTFLEKSLGLEDKFSKLAGLGKDKALGKDGKPGGVMMVDKKRAEDKQKKLENKILTDHLSDDEAKAAAEKYYSDRIRKDREIYLEKNPNEKSVYTDASEKASNLRAQKEGIEKDLNKAREDLKSAQASNDKQKETVALELIATNERRLENNKELLNAEESVIKDISEKATSKTAKRFSEYAKVKDAKTFANMIRAEYASTYRDVTGMDLIGKAMLAVIGTAVPVLAPAIAAKLLYDMGNEVSNMATGATESARKAIIKKAKSTGDKLSKLQAILDKHQEEARKAVEDGLGKSFKTFEDITPDDLENGLLRQEVNLQEELAKVSVDDKYNRAKIQRQIDHLRKMEDRIAKAQKDVEDHRNRESDKADREKDKKENKDKDKGK